MIYARNKVGRYGFPGIGIFEAGETKEITTTQAALLEYNEDFEVLFSDDQERDFRDNEGNPAYIGFAGHVANYTGYGTGGISIIKALYALGLDVKYNSRYIGCNPRAIESFHQHTPKELRGIFERKAYIPDLEIDQCLPQSIPATQSRRRVMWTMWETDQIPTAQSKRGRGISAMPGPPEDFGNWEQIINDNAEVLVVPCEHNKQVFTEAGVRVPIYTVPYGIDVDQWPYQARKRHDKPFVFFQFGDLSARKGPAEAIEAFQKAFPDNQDVRFVLKTYRTFDTLRMVPEIRDPRITIIDEVWDHNRLLQALHNVDCFVWLSRGEGWGLPPMQALLTGLPVITTIHTGMKDWLSPSYVYEVECAGKSEAFLGGSWYEPSIDSAIARMQEVYNKAPQRTKQSKAANSIRKHYTIDAMAKVLHSVLASL